MQKTDADGGPQEGLTRRGLLAGALAAGAAAGLPAAAQARGEDPRRAQRQRSRRGRDAARRADVVIVGAGFAGLTAALTLSRAGRSVIVLEARERVGGRAWNHDLGGGVISERGATFVGPTQDRVMALAQQMGVGTFPTYDGGDDLYLNGSERLRYSDTGITGTAPPDPVILPDLALVVSRLDEMSRSVPVEAPWQAANAALWEGYTLDRWIAENSITESFRQLAPVATRPIFGAEPRELSLLFTLYYIAASGNRENPGTFERNFDTRGGAQQSRFIGGSQLICERVAQHLGARRVLLGEPVGLIEQDRLGVKVSSERLTVRARQAVVAIPPALAARIDYAPILPFQRDQLTQRWGQGTLTKVAAVYPTPFWRADGLSGTVVDTGFPISASFDDSPPFASESRGPGIVFGFVGGDNARAYASLSATARRGAVLSQLARWFGPRALAPTAFFETVWAAERWTRGCPVGIPATGALLAYGPWLRQPIGRIHWAGTETADYWNGYMDGAVRSGERVAAEVLAAL